MLIVATWPIRLLGMQAGTPFWFLCATTINDSLKAFFAAWLLKRIVRGPIRLDTLREFLVFLGIAGAAVPLLSALAAMPLRFALGDPLWNAGYQWFLGNALAQAVVTPTLLYWCTGRHGFLNDVRWKEPLLVSIGLIGVLYYAFVLPHATHLPALLYAPVPFLLWSAVRFGPFGTANAIALVAAVAMLGAVDGTGAFSGNSPAANVLSIQMFLLVVAVSLLSLATLIAENGNITEKLRTVLDAAPIPILVATDADDRPVAANRLGYLLHHPAPASTSVTPNAPPSDEGQLDRPTVVAATGGRHRRACR